MISATARPYIAASVPVLREHGLTITRRFYEQMFLEHPELKNVFNQGNQANGSQQTSLAAAVFAYAANIDNPEALGPVADRIAHKHASVGIKPAHYPIVARHLISAIRHVLGDAATPGLLYAWDEAYWLLAGELIAAEARLYERSGKGAGELTDLIVSDVRHESEDVKSYYLTGRDGRSPGPFRPGQYVSVEVQLGELRQLRQYSLCDSPARPYWRIAVKREPRTDTAPQGQVSSHLHATLKRGDTLRVSAAFGNFTPELASARPLALLSAGVGITPMLSVLAALESSSTRPILFAHAARDASRHLFRQELAAARQRLPSLELLTWYEDASVDRSDAQAGRMALSSPLVKPFASGDFYLCGPSEFMREQWRSLIGLGVSPQALHREVFGPESLDHLL